jgi:hypothetical protein
MTPRVPKLEWAWTLRFGGSEYVNSVTLTDAEVVVLQENAWARVQRSTLAEAFARPFRFFESPRDLFAFVTALAERLRESDVRSERDAVRRRFLRAYDPSRVRAETFAWTIERASGDPLQRTMRLEGVGAFGDDRADEPPEHDLPDELFVDGPAGLKLPVAARETVRARLFEALSPGHGLLAANSFPRLDHGRIARRSWAFGASPEGESGVSTEPGVVTRGSYYAHDYGFTEYAPERVLSRSPRVSLNAPEAVEREVLAVLDAAREPW